MKTSRKVGTKRADRRVVDSDGVEWASEFERKVYERLRACGADIRKCDKSDSLTYSEAKPRCVCLDCGGNRVVQERIYTPDLFVITQRSPRGFYLETKGYFPAPKRRLFKDFIKAREDIDVRILFERDNRAPKSKLRYTEYCARYFKIPCAAGVDNVEDLL